MDIETILFCTSLTVVSVAVVIGDHYATKRKEKEYQKREMEHYNQLADSYKSSTVIKKI